MWWLFIAVLFSRALSGQAQLVELTEEAALELAQPSQANQVPYFIEFYAPWCSACKKMDPVLEDLSKYIGDDPHIHIAKLNGVKNKQAAVFFNVTRFPTFVYVKDDHIGVYHGERSLDALKEFVDRVKLPTYSLVDKKDDLWEAVKGNNFEHVTFSLFLPCSGQEDLSCMELHGEAVRAFAATAKKLSMQSSFAIVFDPHGTRLSSVHSQPSSSRVQLCKLDASVPALAPLCTDATGVESMSAFIHEHNYPRVSVMDNHNFARLASLNVTMLLAVVDLQAPASESIIQAVHRGALELGHVDAPLALGILDGLRFRSFCKLHHAFPPSLIVLEHASDRHAVRKLEQHDVLAVTSEILALSRAALDGSLVLVPTEANPSLLAKLVSRFNRYMPWSLVLVLLPVVLAIVSWLSPAPTKRKQH